MQCEYKPPKSICEGIWELKRNSHLRAGRNKPRGPRVRSRRRVVKLWSIQRSPKNEWESVWEEEERREYLTCAQDAIPAGLQQVNLWNTDSTSLTKYKVTCSTSQQTNKQTPWKLLEKHRKRSCIPPWTRFAFLSSYFSPYKFRINVFQNRGLSIDSFLRSNNHFLFQDNNFYSLRKKMSDLCKHGPPRTHEEYESVLTPMTTMQYVTLFIIPSYKKS